MFNQKYRKGLFLTAILCVLTLLGLGGGAEAVPIDGGVTDRTDHHAPKTIVSKNITEFYFHFFLFDEEISSGEGAVHIFTIEREGSVLMAVDAKTGIRFPADKKLLKKLQAIIDKYDLAKKNGIYQVTAGLPVEYQPCDFTAGYASGEILHFTMDNDPDAQWAKDIYQLFVNWFEGRI